MSLEAQAAQLLQVTIQLGLEWFVGLGVGAGANVLLRFACDNPDKVAGLILANGSAGEAGKRSIDREHRARRARRAVLLVRDGGGWYCVQFFCFCVV